MADIDALIHYLQKNPRVLATAESCTGGMLAWQLTNYSGSSAWFDRGFVTYSNNAKHEMLGVPLTAIEKFGAVSEQVALAMAMGALSHSDAAIAIAITGIAGPTGGGIKKPIGTVCFALANNDGVAEVSTQVFESQNREEVRKSACDFAVTMLLNQIAGLKS